MTIHPTQSKVTVNRTLLGSISVVLLTGAAVLCFFYGSQNVWAGACLKVGSVMGAFWLAFPTISRTGNWGQVSWSGMIGYTGLAIILLGKRVDTRVVVPLMMGIAIATIILRPRSRSKS